MRGTRLASAVLLAWVIGICWGDAVKEDKAGSYKEDFEKAGCEKAWRIDGDAKVSADQFHGGKKSLAVPLKATATWTIGKDDKYGQISFWVYDSKAGLAKPKAGAYSKGPSFGLTNSAGETFVLAEIALEGNTNFAWGDYYYCFSTKPYS